MKEKSRFRFSWFVLFFAVFSIITYQSEQEKKERDAEFYGNGQQQPRLRVQEDKRGSGLPANIRQGVLPDDSLERMYDRNYMDYDPEHDSDRDDEWHDYFND